LYADTKYGKYQLPGGQNYREIALTLPGKEIYRAPDAHSMGESADVNRIAHIRMNDRIAEGDGPYEVTVRDYGKTKGRGTVKTFSTIAEANAFIDVKKAGGYNTELRNLGVERVLFIEEIQSDWGQQGRERGFNNPVYTEKRNDGWYVINPGQGTELLVESEAEANNFANSINKVVREIPVGPFVTKTKNWVALALKRILALAENEGYRKVAFINGEQSAERYDLSNHVSVIEVIAKGDVKSVTIRPRPGVADIGNFDINSDGLIIQSYGNELVGKNLSDVIGKEMAEKIMDAPKK